MFEDPEPFTCLLLVLPRSGWEGLHPLDVKVSYSVHKLGEEGLGGLQSCWMTSLFLQRAERPGVLITSQAGLSMPKEL